MTAAENEMYAELERLRAALVETKALAVDRLEIAAALIRKQHTEINSQKVTIVSLASAGVAQCERLEQLQPLADLAWRFARGDARTSDVMDQLAKLGGLEIKRRDKQS